MSTVRDAIKEALAKAGVENAQSVQVVFDNGDTTLIVSGRNPALERPADEVSRLEFKQSAEAGWTELPL